MPLYTVDFNFIRDLEGLELKGYIPNEAGETHNRVLSGVTIGTGFDLGQHKSIEEFNIPENIAVKLRPYVGLTGTKAKLKLQELPLTLTAKEATIVDNKVKEYKLKYLVEAYQKDSGKPFESLTKPQQTVIMSVYFQYGDLRKRAPKFWRKATKQDWLGVVAELENFGDSFKRRRLKEAKYLRQGIDV